MKTMVIGSKTRTISTGLSLRLKNSSLRHLKEELKISSQAANLKMMKITNNSD
jgi:hypothetical protein